MRSGYLYISDSNKYLVAGRNSDLWSGVASTWGSVTIPTSTGINSVAYNLFFDTSDSRSSNAPYRLYAWSLRCLSTAVEGEESGMPRVNQSDGEAEASLLDEVYYAWYDDCVAQSIAHYEKWRW